MISEVLCFVHTAPMTSISLFGPLYSTLPGGRPSAKAIYTFEDHASWMALFSDQSDDVHEGSRTPAAECIESPILEWIHDDGVSVHTRSPGDDAGQVVLKMY